MKFKSLTDSDKELIAKVHSNTDISWDERMQVLIGRFKVSERTIRRWINRLKISKRSEEKPLEDSPDFKKAKAKVLGESKYYLVTWAQNATPVHSKFWQNIQVYAESLQAEIHVIAGRYRNPTSVFTDSEHDWWAKDVVPFLDANRHDVHPLLSLLSDIKIQPTASMPLSGLDSVSGIKSAIVGHPKVHFQSLPVLEGHDKKVLLTTGACTVPNYTDSKAGAKGLFHHTFGFAVVEVIDEKTFIVRQVTANNDGSFTDIDNVVKNGEIRKSDGCAFFVMGDLHPVHLDYEHYQHLLSFLERVRPERLVLHDVFDGYCISHHHEKDPIEKYRKHVNSLDSVEKEIQHMNETLEDLVKYNPVVVRSNHDDFIDRWVRTADWKKDIPNSYMYIEMVSLLLNDRAEKGLIPYYIEKHFGDKVQCLARDESFKINGWELAHHGDIGPNGSRGSLGGFSKLNTKVIIGHGHSPHRLNGSLAVGTSTKLRQEYNKGASSWLHAHAIGHKDQKAQLIVCFNNNFTSID